MQEKLNYKTNVNNNKNKCRHHFDFEKQTHY